MQLTQMFSDFLYQSSQRSTFPYLSCCLAPSLPSDSAPMFICNLSSPPSFLPHHLPPSPPSSLTPFLPHPLPPSPFPPSPPPPVPNYSANIPISFLTTQSASSPSPLSSLEFASLHLVSLLPPSPSPPLFSLPLFPGQIQGGGGGGGPDPPPPLFETILFIQIAPE